MLPTCLLCLPPFPASFPPCLSSLLPSLPLSLPTCLPSCLPSPPHSPILSLLLLLLLQHAEGTMHGGVISKLTKEDFHLHTRCFKITERLMCDDDDDDDDSSSSSSSRECVVVVVVVVVVKDRSLKSGHCIKEDYKYIER